MQAIEIKSNKIFYYWLIASFFLVYLMILIGGLTRLTDSGLSITEWELFSGILPPLSLSDWEKYFSLYKEIPQYQILFNDMNLDEFKIIFYWEYFHRILGRLIGLFFLIPLVYFHFKKRINKKYLSNCYLIMFLILLQGVVGWYMVSSGLVNNVSVSHYRLSLHLFIAFIIISMIFWMLLNFKNKTLLNFFNFKKESFFFYFLIFLIFTQIILGAFVSGLDAGKIYQTWPLMNLNYLPDEIIIKNYLDLLNFSDLALVQFYHRNIAYMIALVIIAYGFYIFIKKQKKMIAPFYFLFSILLVQVILGILTLISGLNIYLASAHQIFSVLLILTAINLYFYHIK